MNKASIANILNTDTPSTYVPSISNPTASATSAETPTSSSPLTSASAVTSNMDSGFLDATFVTPLNTHQQYPRDQIHMFPRHHNFPLPDNTMVPRHSPSNNLPISPQSQPNADIIRPPLNFHPTFHPNFPAHVGAAANIVQGIPRIRLVPNEEVEIYKNLNAIVLNRDLLDTMGRRTDATADAYMKVPDTLRQVFDFKNTIVSTDPNNPLVEQNRAIRKKRFRRTKQQMLEDAIRAKEKDGNNAGSSSSPRRGRKRTKNSFQRPHDRLKRPRNGYMIFMNEVYEDTKLKNPNLKFGEISAAIGERWKNMSKEEQMPYHHKHEQEKLQYENAKQAMSKGTICFVEENIPSSSERQRAAREIPSRSLGNTSTSILVPSQLLTPKSPAAKLPTLKLSSATSESVSPPPSPRDMTVEGGHALFMQSSPTSEDVIRVPPTGYGSPAAPLLVTPLTTLPREVDETRKSTPAKVTVETSSKISGKAARRSTSSLYPTTSRFPKSNFSKINEHDCDGDDDVSVGEDDNSSSVLSPKSSEQIGLVDDDQDIAMDDVEIDMDQDVNEIAGLLRVEEEEEEEDDNEEEEDDEGDNGEEEEDDDAENMEDEEITQSSHSTNGASQLKVKKQKGIEELAEKELVDDDDDDEDDDDCEVESVKHNVRKSPRRNILVERVTRSSLKGKFVLNSDSNRDSAPRHESSRIAKLLLINERTSANAHDRPSRSSSKSKSKLSSIASKSDDNYDEDEVDSDNVSDASGDTRNKWHFPIIGTKTSPGLTPHRKRKVNSVDDSCASEPKATKNHGRRVGGRGGGRGRKTTQRADDAEGASVKIYKRKKVY